MAVPTARVAVSGATSTPVVFSFATTTLGAGHEPTPAPMGGQPGSNATQGTAGTETGANAMARAGATQVSGVINVADVNGTPQLLDHGVATPTPSAWWAQTGPVSADLANELGAAYERFWDTRAQVLLNLDPGPLGDVESGSWLTKDAAALDQLRNHHQPEQINVQHQIQILHATADDATIRDDYSSYIVPVDADTNTPLTPSPSGTSHLIYHFQKVSGTWKVVDAVQASAS